MKKMVEGYIYVAQNPLFPDFVKIGRTQNVAERMKKLGTGVPVPYKVLHSELVINDVKVETHLHQMFGHLRQNGEWFRINDIEKIKKEINSIQDEIRYEGEVGFGETIREKYQIACDKVGVGGYSGFELNEIIKFFSKLDARKVDAAIQKHAESLLDCYEEMEYV
jgi:hypothetical protein